MRLIATVPARNEVWCLEASLKSLLKFCDAAIILDHASTDETPNLLGWLANQYPGRIHLLHESDPVWREASYRQRLLNKARELGATHVATVDADEILTANAIGEIRGLIESLGPNEVLRVPWLMLWGSLTQYRAGDKSVWSSSMASIAFPANAGDYPTDDYDIHTRVPAGLSERVQWPLRNKGLMHLQHVSRRRLLAKDQLYRLNERLRWGKGAEEIEARYGRTTDETGMNLLPVPDEWGVPDVDADAEPWQEAEVKRLAT